MWFSAPKRHDGKPLVRIEAQSHVRATVLAQPEEDRAPGRLQLANLIWDIPARLAWCLHIAAE
jgi:hypothetical protein